MNRNQKKRGRLSAWTLMILLLLVAGIALLGYPFLSDCWNRYHASTAIAAYGQQVSTISEEERSAYFAQAQAYNQSILSRDEQYILSDEDRIAYEDVLNLSGDGVMGYIEIPGLHVTLPIYHGTEEKVLQKAAGHLEWSSLPVGGSDTHCVISGHSGLPSAQLFTDLDQMEIGDIFRLNVLDQVLTYEVDQILVVEPKDLEALYIVPGEDLCTLVTCTPYGINSHRLLVRGHRITENEASEVRQSSGDKIENRIWIGIALLLVTGAAAWLLRKKRCAK